MKQAFLSLAIATSLAGCSREEKSALAPSQGPPPSATVAPALDASTRLDVALIHDHTLAAEGQAKDQHPRIPALPPMADDATFLRRACVDLAGRLPHADEARKFLADTAPNKRAMLTDSLTREPGAAEVRYRLLAEAFRVKDDPEVIAWLRQAAAVDRPYADIITHMIGGGKMRQRDEGDALRTSVETAYSMLGEDVYCAMCHDHPFNDHTEMGCYSFAASFAGKNQMRLPGDYLYKNGRPGEVVQPAVLRVGRGSPWYLRDDEDNLAQIARWMVKDEASRRYAMVASLRVWSSLFGMPGLMVNHTTGGMDDAPPWHGVHRKPILNHISSDCFSGSPRGRPTWVDKAFNSSSDFSQAPKLLIEEFLRCGGRIGEFQRILARTAAYSRAGHAPSKAWDGCYLVPSPQIRRLPAEVIWKVCSGEQDAQLPEVPPPGHPLRMLGRGTREWTDESLAPISHDLARFMMKQAAEDSKTVSTDDLFLTLLGRQPGDMERTAISRHEASSQDVAWALMNTTEFMFRP
ncbi:MAG: DUF1549 domain-containing protein [Prosthecobacter sp.]